MKAFTLLLVSVVIFLSGVVRAQITEVHSFSEEVYPFNTSNGVWYSNYIMGNDSSISIYKQDFTHYRDIVFASKYVYVSMLSDKLFNTDNKLEYLAQYMHIDNNLMDISIYNEDGDLVFELGKNLVNAFYSIINRKDQKPLLYFGAYDGTNVSIKIYELPGENLQINEIQESLTNGPYPNPAGEIIEIPINSKSSDLLFRVFNVTGKMVEQKVINQFDEKILLQTGGFQPGAYFYSGGGVNGKFVVR